eukprot:gnl/TRDRNA2_/TRDRNA2_136537_c1_seq2.p1 gnl/TRDRNA2_/TRDRNA2_136537_c1~~gnl/TRDRNA2_/TRDRNA2_136537_c1_seq2.p1  ORF type:complete len:514 (-),score=49.85 gnl/TRDRNA2_/TRDRNA2_136537_c1_seq2:18-1559(-)
MRHLLFLLIALAPDVTHCGHEQLMMWTDEHGETYALNNQLGNPFCFTSNAEFNSCCTDRGADIGCWDGGQYSYEICCYHSPIYWLANKGSAVAIREGAAGLKSDSMCAPSLSAATGCCAHDERYAAWGRPLSERIARIRDTERFTLHDRNFKACAKSKVGRPYKIKLVWSNMLHVGWGQLSLRNVSKHTVAPFIVPREFGFKFCAPVNCSTWEVAALSAPAYFANSVRHTTSDWPIEAFVSEVHAWPLSSRPPPAAQMLGSVGARVPLATKAEVEAYKRLFWICGLCELARYGLENDGGYLMCSLDGENSVALVGAYSYGIAGEDAWGEAIARTLGIVVHQYDCFDASRPVCKAPCLMEFHDECLTAQTSSFGDTLAGHLEKNGHEGVGEAQLLLKLDIEGAEWGVLHGVKGHDLRKFRQIVVELHDSFLMSPVDERRLRLRVSMLSHLLEDFVIVHIHENNACEDAQCLEVTLIHRAYAVPTICRAPFGRHALEKTNFPTRPLEGDIGRLFA